MLLEYPYTLITEKWVKNIQKTGKIRIEVKQIPKN